ncbi:hypothetical protein K788_0002427 [Paraburkholderia caribensis MBA4]|uniref:Uncharacterized protein n=1 Tax=Paraburkholderia caribensis MBA4 TaxID=1323664 RepID=A0A0P0RA85_9BURK|nr:hypothetical protein [Paraburkholderia caribensis]ALL64923.1 hypothetical protein K788_0002427 [Paraburkholderia caribensis MBA4]
MRAAEASVLPSYGFAAFVRCLTDKRSRPAFYSAAFADGDIFRLERACVPTPSDAFVRL